MFSNLSWYEVVALLLLALFIFGDKLPKVISEGLRMLRSLRRMAQNATTDLSRELGTDIQLEDLHPRTFVRKHLLSEADQESLLHPLKAASDDMVRQTREMEGEVRDLGRRTDGVVGDVRRAATPRDGQRGSAGQRRGAGPGGSDGQRGSDRQRGRTGGADPGVDTAAAGGTPPAAAQQPGAAEQPAGVGDATRRQSYEDVI